jgi:hypothetical protein
MNSLVDYHCTTSDSSDKASIHTTGEDVDCLHSDKERCDEIGCELHLPIEAADGSLEGEPARRHHPTDIFNTTPPTHRIRRFPRVEGQWAMAVQIPGAQNFLRVLTHEDRIVALQLASSCSWSTRPRDNYIVVTHIEL